MYGNENLLCLIINYFMGEIHSDSGKPKRGVPRAKKRSTRVDLTPMVDLGFLLITFFVFTTSMSEPKGLDLKMPADGPPTNIGNDVVLTIFPMADNKIFYYHGELGKALIENLYGITDYSTTNGIGNIIRQKQIALDNNGKGRKEMMLIIKPTDVSSFGNTIDILDEVLINVIPRYAITTISEEEKKHIAVKNIKL